MGPLLILLQLATPFASPSVSPVILVPGLAGSVFTATTTDYKGPHAFCSGTVTKPFTLWVAITKLVPKEVDCTLDRLLLHFDANTGAYKNTAGVNLDTNVDFGGVGGVEYLDPDLKVSASAYFAPLHVFSSSPVLDACQTQPGVTCYRSTGTILESNLVITPKAELGTSVLFSGARLRKLHARTFELECINKTEKANFKELHRAKNRLERAKVALHAQITRLKGKCDDLQMLKFGQLIKLDILDRDSKNNEGERALNMKINMINAAHASQLGKLNRRQSLLNDQLLQVTRRNTQYLARIALLSSSQYQLEKEINVTKALSSGVSTGSDSVPMIRREVEERNRLVALVKLQAREI